MSKEEKTDSTIPGRNKVREEDTWDLSKLYADDSAWEKGFEEFQSLIPEIGTYKGTLGESPEKLREFLDFMNRIGILEERLGYYAHLRMSEDGGNNDHQAKMARFIADIEPGGSPLQFLQDRTPGNTGKNDEQFPEKPRS